MRYRQLDRTGLKVSELCIGTMTFGEQNSEAEGHAQMDCAVDCGINLFDAAEIYPVPPKRETQGRTESIIGTWLARQKKREKVLVATKIAVAEPPIDCARTARPRGKVRRRSGRQSRQV